MTKKYETILLGGGCFWCVEAILKSLRGIESVQSGYAGGHTVNPTYKEVCTGETDHAEVVKVVYDPEIISTELLLSIFFTIHNPTELNRQGNDIGTQYRSVIFGNEEQREIARKVIAKFEQDKIWDAPIQTLIEPETEFYPAEEYHEDYFARNPENAYCAAVVAPKVLKARKLFKDLLR